MVVTLLKSMRSEVAVICVFTVNNAGVGLVGPVEGLSMDDMMTVFQTNFFGAVRMIKAVMPDMKRRCSGHIIVISSAMGLQGKH